MAFAAPSDGRAPAADRPSLAGSDAWSSGAAYDRLTALAERLGRTIAVARGLTASNRLVDLAGLEDGVGLLCAKTLDLDFEDSRRLVPALLELRAQIDGLSATIAGLRHAAAGAGRREAPRAGRREAH